MVDADARHAGWLMRHTCDTVRSGSERSENTCAACSWDMAERMRKGSYPIPTGYGDITSKWYAYVAPKKKRHEDATPTTSPR